MLPGAEVDLAAGLWAVLLTAVLGGILAVTLLPVIRRRQEAPVCNVPGSMGQHPLGDPGEDGVRRCGCGMVTRIQSAPRTDTREHSWPDPLEDLPDTPAEFLARASGHPSVWEAPTDERPIPHIVWPPPA